MSVKVEKSHVLLTVKAAVLLVIFSCCECQNVEYSELVSMGVNCPGRDSCQDGTISRNFSTRNCECDSRCDSYGDCCFDGSTRRRPPPSGPSQQVPKYKCIVLGNSKTLRGVYAISRCNSRWNGHPLIRQNCEGSHDNISDPILATPATDLTNMKTYRNFYCAECNNIDASQLLSWEVIVRCDLRTAERVTDEYVRDNLVYSKSTNQWGINYRNSSTNPTFHACNLDFGLPREGRRSVRLCRPYVVSTCAAGWTQRSVSDKCAAYMAVVYTDQATYKNPHCATCNRVQPGSMKCSQTDLKATARPTTMSITMLFDVNRKDGPCVGRLDDNCRCQEGQKWDSFFKKCRNLVCGLPGFSRVNGRCQGPG